MREGVLQIIRFWVLAVAVFVMLLVPKGVLHAESLTYMDENGNEFCYETDKEGDAVITGITASGGDLLIPESIEGATVTMVGNGDNCVVSNPEVTIPSLEINCGVVGVKAFSQLSIGTLVIGENVSGFSLSQSGTTTLTYGQFASSKIDHVIYRAAAVAIEVPASNLSPYVLWSF